MTSKLEQLLNEKQMKRLIENGMSQKTVYHRIMYSKWDIDHAIDTPSDARFGRKDGYKLLHGHKVTDAQLGIAEQNNISIQTLSYRLKTGMSVENAINQEIKPRKNKPRKPGKLTARERALIFGEPSKKTDKYVKAIPEKWKPSPYSADLFNHVFKRWGVIASEKRKPV